MNTTTTRPPLPGRLHKDGRHILNQQDCYIGEIEMTSNDLDVRLCAALVHRYNMHDQLRTALADLLNSAGEGSLSRAHAIKRAKAALANATRQTQV